MRGMKETKGGMGRRSWCGTEEDFQRAPNGSVIDRQISIPLRKANDCEPGPRGQTRRGTQGPRLMEAKEGGD